MKNKKSKNDSKTRRSGDSGRDQTTSNDSSKIYTFGNNTLQTPEEHAHDQSIDPAKNDTYSNSTDDYSPTEHYRMSGTGYSGGNRREQK